MASLTPRVKLAAFPLLVYQFFPFFFLSFIVSDFIINIPFLKYWLSSYFLAAAAVVVVGKVTVAVFTQTFRCLVSGHPVSVGHEKRFKRFPAIMRRGLGILWTENSKRRTEDEHVTISEQDAARCPLLVHWPRHWIHVEWLPSRRRYLCKELTRARPPHKSIIYGYTIQFSVTV